MQTTFAMIGLRCLVLCVESSFGQQKDEQVDLKPYVKFTNDFAEWLEKDDAKKVAESIDTSSLVTRALVGTTLNDLEKFRAAFQVSKFAGKYLELIKTSTGKEGSFKLLRVRVQDGEVRAIWRLISTPAGVNYHDMVLKNRKDGTVCIGDIYLFVSAEYLSDVARRILLQGELGDFLLKGGKEPRETTEGLRKVPEMLRLIQSGQSREALQVWEALPDTLKKEKNVQLIRVMAASALVEEPDLYVRVFEEFKKAYPKDAATELVQIDYLFEKKKYKELHDAINRLDNKIGGDPYLDVIRGTAHKLGEKLIEARLAGERAIGAEATLKPAYELLLSVSLQAKRHADTSRWLLQLERRFKVPVEIMVEEPDFEAFRKSPEYRQWKAKRKEL